MSILFAFRFAFRQNVYSPSLLPPLPPLSSSLLFLSYSFFFLLSIRAQPKIPKYELLYSLRMLRILFCVCTYVKVSLCSVYTPMFVYHSNYAFNFWTNISLVQLFIRPKFVFASVCVCVCVFICVMRITYSHFSLALE